MSFSIHDRIDVIETNLDDLQSGLEAESRAISSVRDDAARVDQLLTNKLRTASLIGSLVRNTRELVMCLRDQRAALAEARENMARLRAEVRDLCKTR